MSLTFYRAPMSTATLTELVFAELGVPHEVVTVDLTQKENKKPAHLERDPNGRVPVIVHDGVPIWESAAITIYLGETFGAAKGLWPAPGPKRGEAMKWVVWTNVTLGEAVSRWQRNVAWAPNDERNAKAGETAKADVHAALRILDEALEGRAFVCGDYGLADTHAHSFLDWVRHLGIDFGPYKRIQEWSKRCASRPAYVKVMSSAS